MGYESRVSVVVRRTYGENDAMVYGEKIAEMNMCKMGYESGWRELFKREIDYTFYNEYAVDDDDAEIVEDAYGDILKAAPIEDVIAWLEKEMKRDDYWRLPVLYAMLTAIREKIPNNVEVVHYGY